MEFYSVILRAQVSKYFFQHIESGLEFFRVFMDFNEQICRSLSRELILFFYVESKLPN